MSILMVFAAVYDSELPVTTAWNSALHDACGRAGEGGHESAHGFAGRQFTRRRHPYKAHPSPSGNQVVSNVTENTTLPDDSVRVGAVATPTCRVQPRGGDETTRTPLGGAECRWTNLRCTAGACRNEERGRRRTCGGRDLEEARGSGGHIGGLRRGKAHANRDDRQVGGASQIPRRRPATCTYMQNRRRVDSVKRGRDSRAVHGVHPRERVAFAWLQRVDRNDEVDHVVAAVIGVGWGGACGERASPKLRGRREGRGGGGAGWNWS